VKRQADAPPAVAPWLVLVGASLLFAVMAMLAKLAARRLPGPEVAFIRFAIGCGSVGIAALRVRLRAENKRGLVQRGLLGGTAVLCYFLAIEHLPVGIATLMNYTAPVFTALWAALLLAEPLDPKVGAALAITTAGVAMVVTGNGGGSALGLGRWELVGVLGAILSGAAVATIREVRRTDGSWEIFGAFCFAGALITGIPTLRSWVQPSAAEWVLVLLVGLVSVAAQLGMTWSLRYTRAAVAGIITQLTPVAALALGAGLLGERIAGIALAGAAITVGGVTWGALLAAQPQGDELD
jgi:drug/metabolite transporter (DMT)-like permease